jgi:hypothetical protein
MEGFMLKARELKYTLKMGFINLGKQNHYLLHFLGME